MCAVTGRPPAFECALGDIAPGTQFHDPNGELWMVLALPRTADSTMVVNLGNGQGNTYGNALCANEFAGRVTPMYSDAKLGRDHKGRLYASTFLNDWKYEVPAATVVDDAVTPLLPEVLPDRDPTAPLDDGDFDGNIGQYS